MRRLGVVAFVLVSLVGSKARAEGDVGDGTSVVEVNAAGDAATTARMAERVQSLAARLHVSMRWAERPEIDARAVLDDPEPHPSVLARVWLDLADPARAVLFIANATHDRFLVRVVPTVGGYGEVTQESLTTIIESVIDALAAGGQIGVDRTEAVREIEARVEAQAPEQRRPEADPAPEPDPGPEPAPEEAPRAGRLPRALTLAYRIDLVSEGPAVRQAPELSLSWTGFLDPALDLLIWVGARYSLASTLGEDTRGVVLRGGGARAALGLTGALGSFVWQAAVGGGIDRFDVEPRFSPTTGLSETDPFAIVVPVATLFASGGVRPVSWLDVLVSVGLDVDLSGHHFDVEGEAARNVLFDPWLAHPFASVGLGLPFEL